MNRLKLLQGKWRLWRGYCPECNSDAPEVDTCEICECHDSQMNWKPREFPPDEERKTEWWTRFIQPRNLTDEEADRFLIRPGGVTMLLFGWVILRTCRALVNRAFERGRISSHAYHELHAIIDRTLK